MPCIPTLAFVSWTFRSTFKGIKLVHLFLSTIEYADDQMLFTLSPDGLQEMLDFLSATALPLGLRLAPDKCELICFHRPGTVDKRALPVIKLGDIVVPWKSSVIYLGSLFTEDGNTLSAVKHRICCAETIVKHLKLAGVSSTCCKQPIERFLHQLSSVCISALRPTILCIRQTRSTMLGWLFPSTR